jgi:hypothetical protein
MLVPREALAGYTGGNVSTAQPRAAAGGQVGVARERVIVNVLDERMLDKFLSTTEGQDAIVNVISSNSRKVRRVLEG